MRTLLLAALLAAAPTAAEAAVTISFSDPAAGSGTIVIDADHVGPLTTLGDGTSGYAGDGAAFLTATFTPTGGQQLLLQQGSFDGYVSLDANTISVQYTSNQDDGSGAFPFSVLTLAADSAPLASYGGVQLPNFAAASGVYFLAQGADGQQVFGQPTRVTVDAGATAVPEPATWATMLLGFGLIGAALRRRQGIATLAV